MSRVCVLFLFVSAAWAAGGGGGEEPPDLPIDPLEYLVNTTGTIGVALTCGELRDETCNNCRRGVPDASAVVVRPDLSCFEDALAVCMIDLLALSKITSFVDPDETLIAATYTEVVFDFEEYESQLEPDYCAGIGTAMPLAFLAGDHGYWAGFITELHCFFSTIAISVGSAQPAAADLVPQRYLDRALRARLVAGDDWSASGPALEALLPRMGTLRVLTLAFLGRDSDDVLLDVPVAQFANLTGLHLDGSPRLAAPFRAALAALPELVALAFSDHQDVEGPDNAGTVEWIAANLTHLEALSLTLRGTESVDLDQLAEVSGLRFLAVSAANVTDGLPLDWGLLEGLEMLYVELPVVSEIPEEWGDLDELRTLRVVANAVTDLSAIGQMDALECLTVEVEAEYQAAVGHLPLPPSMKNHHYTGGIDLLTFPLLFGVLDDDQEICLSPACDLSESLLVCYGVRGGSCCGVPCCDDSDEADADEVIAWTNTAAGGGFVTVSGKDLLYDFDEFLEDSADPGDGTLSHLDDGDLVRYFAQEGACAAVAYRLVLDGSMLPFGDDAVRNVFDNLSVPWVFEIEVELDAEAPGYAEAVEELFWYFQSSTQFLPRLIVHAEGTPNVTVGVSPAPFVSYGYIELAAGAGRLDAQTVIDMSARFFSEDLRYYSDHLAEAAVYNNLPTMLLEMAPNLEVLRLVDCDLPSRMLSHQDTWLTDVHQGDVQTALRHLELSGSSLGNQLSGSLPEALTTVHTLLLSDTQLFGTLPADFGPMPLANFDVSHNPFLIGALPAGLADREYSQVFDLFGTNVNGTVDVSDAVCTDPPSTCRLNPCVRCADAQATGAACGCALGGQGCDPLSNGTALVLWRPAYVIGDSTVDVIVSAIEESGEEAVVMLGFLPGDDPGEEDEYLIIGIDVVNFTHITAAPLLVSIPSGLSRTVRQGKVAAYGTGGAWRGFAAHLNHGGGNRTMALYEHAGGGYELADQLQLATVEDPVLNVVALRCNASAEDADDLLFLSSVAPSYVRRASGAWEAVALTGTQAVAGKFGDQAVDDLLVLDGDELHLYQNDGDLACTWTLNASFALGGAPAPLQGVVAHDQDLDGYTDFTTITYDGADAHLARFRRDPQTPMAFDPTPVTEIGTGPHAVLPPAGGSPAPSDRGVGFTFYEASMGPERRVGYLEEGYAPAYTAPAAFAGDVGVMVASAMMRVEEDVGLLFFVTHDPALNTYDTVFYYLTTCEKSAAPGAEGLAAMLAELGGPEIK